MTKGNRLIKLSHEIYQMDEHYFHITRPNGSRHTHRTNVRDNMNKQLWKEDWVSDDIDDFYISNWIRMDFYKKRGNED
jgi:hypothetical protein